MKRTSIYWKTVLISISIILISITILFSLFSILLPTITQNIQQQTFVNQIEKVRKEIEENGINASNLSNLEEVGIRLSILKGSEIIYPTFSSSLLDMELQEFTSNQSDEIVILYDPIAQEDTFIKEITVYHNDTPYTVTVYKYIYFSISDSKLLIQSIFPYFIGVGILVSLIFSHFYAKYFYRKINHLVKLMDKMKNQKTAFVTSKYSGDELHNLENEIISLHKQLCNEIQVVKKFEEERQLFLRGITHELKTPIMIMGVNIESILNLSQKSPHQQELLQECYVSLQAMSSLVNEILDIAKIEHIKDLKENQVSLAIEDLLETYHCLFEDRKISIDMQQNDNYFIKLPHHHLTKIISNIFSNVVKYAPTQSTFHIMMTETSIHFKNTMMDNATVNIDQALKAFTTFDDKEVSFQKSHGLGLYIISSILNQYQIPYHCWIEDNTFNFEIKK